MSTNKDAQKTPTVAASSPQLSALLARLNTLAVSEKLPANTNDCVEGALRDAYAEFHSATRNPKLKWTQERFIFPHTIEINEKFGKRAERYIRGIIKFEQECREVEAYLRRRRNKTA